MKMQYAKGNEKQKELYLLKHVRAHGILLSKNLIVACKSIMLFEDCSYAWTFALNLNMDKHEKRKMI